MSINGFSIIIPAHNESSGIERTLHSILACKLDRVLQIIVVANGCTDDTAARARAVPGPITVIETAIGNKVHALNLGDREALYFPRAYLDADILLTENALEGVANAFNDPNCRIAAPTPRHRYHGWNPFLAGYYQLWRSLPYVRGAIMGSGFYAIDAQTRSRFTEFPSITADDKFVRNVTKPEERRVVPGCFATVSMPATFSDLLKVKTRWTYGNLELAATHPQLAEGDKSHHDGALRYLLLRPWLWPHIPAFLFVYRYAHRAAQKRFAAKAGGWERDNSTRPLAHETRPAA